MKTSAFFRYHNFCLMQATSHNHRNITKRLCAWNLDWGPDPPILYFPSFSLKKSNASRMCDLYCHVKKCFQNKFHLRNGNAWKATRSYIEKLSMGTNQVKQCVRPKFLSCYIEKQQEPQNVFETPRVVKSWQAIKYSGNIGPMKSNNFMFKTTYIILIKIDSGLPDVFVCTHDFEQ